MNSFGVSPPATLVLLAAPTFTNVSDTQVTVGWQPLADAVGYVLERSADGGSSWTTVSTTADPTGTTDTGLAGGTDYEYEVTAQLPGDVSVNSAPAVASTLEAAPGGLTATYISGDEIDLAWRSNSPAADGFQVQESSGGVNWTEVGTTDVGQSSYIVRGPFSSSASWQFEVRALDGAGNAGVASAAASVAVPTGLPAAPTNLSATAGSACQVTLGWSDATGDAMGYIVERQQSGDSGWQDIAATATTGYVDNTVQPETTYSYRVVATSAAGGSAPSNSATVQTGLLPPTGVRATVLSGGQVELDWSVDSTAGGGFTVVESTSSTGPWTTVADSSTVPANATSTVISGAFADNQTYYFEVCKAGATPSAFSAAAQVTVPNLPAAPTDFSASVGSAEEIDLTWTDTNSGQASYRLERSSSLDSGWTLLAASSFGASNYADSSVVPGVTYFYRLTASASAGLSGAVSATVVSGATNGGICTTSQLLAPTDFMVLADGLYGVTFRWHNPNPNSYNPDLYAIEIDWNPPGQSGGWSCAYHHRRQNVWKRGAMRHAPIVVHS